MHKKKTQESQTKNFIQFSGNKISKLFKVNNNPTVLSFFHLWIRPSMPEVTDSSPSDGGYKSKESTCNLL